MLVTRTVLRGPRSWAVRQINGRGTVTEPHTHVRACGGAAIDVIKYDGHSTYRRNTAQAEKCRESPAEEKALGLYLDG